MPPTPTPTPLPTPGPCPPKIKARVFRTTLNNAPVWGVILHYTYKTGGMACSYGFLLSWAEAVEKALQVVKSARELENDRIRGI